MYSESESCSEDPCCTPNERLGVASEEAVVLWPFFGRSLAVVLWLLFFGHCSLAVAL